MITTATVTTATVEELATKAQETQETQETPTKQLTSDQLSDQLWELVRPARPVRPNLDEFDDDDETFYGPQERQLKTFLLADLDGPSFFCDFFTRESLDRLRQLQELLPNAAREVERIEGKLKKLDDGDYSELDLPKSSNSKNLLLLADQLTSAQQALTDRRSRLGAQLDIAREHLAELAGEYRKLAVSRARALEEGGLLALLDQWKEAEAEAYRLAQKLYAFRSKAGKIDIEGRIHRPTISREPGKLTFWFRPA